MRIVGEFGHGQGAVVRSFNWVTYDERVGWPTIRNEMAERVRAHDWAPPLGPVDAWPRSLKTATNICLSSAFASFVWWGPNQSRSTIMRRSPSYWRSTPLRSLRPHAKLGRRLGGDQLAGGARRQHGGAGARRGHAYGPRPRGRRGAAYFTFSYSALHRVVRLSQELNAKESHG